MELQQQLGAKQVPIMTHAQVKSLAILQMPILDLQAEVRKELEENPLLELSEAQEHFDFDAELHRTYSYKELVQLAEESTYCNYDDAGADEYQDPFSKIQTAKTLKQQLCAQLLELSLDVKQVRLCNYIIESIDSRGFFTGDLHDISDQLGAEQGEVLQALAVVQGLSPVGVASRNLKEYLRLQLTHSNTQEEKLFFIVTHCLELLAENKVKEIAKKIGAKVEETADYCRRIKALNPFPAKGFFTGEQTELVIPDAFLTEENGVWSVIINERPIPRLRVSRIYKTLLKSSADTAEKEYVKVNMQKAVAFINQIEQRKHTLQKILAALAEMQTEYFKTARNLKPMTLKDIAQQVDLHESTISRAIRRKYVMIQSNVLCVKDMFSSKVDFDMGPGPVSSADVKKEIERLLASEDKKNPLSDQVISERLNETGLAISRRTVAKYREAMRIRSSSKRRLF